MLLHERTFDQLGPANEREKHVMAHPEVAEGLWWGKPRPGHDEGEVIKHVSFIFKNIDRLSILGGDGKTAQAAVERDSELWRKLRLIAIIHDSFKYQVDPKQSKSGENHHAMRARRFAERAFPEWYDEPMREILELHDEAYNAWCKGSRDDKWDKAEIRAKALLDRLGDNHQLFMIFYTCDTHIGDVDRPDWNWWRKICLKYIGHDYPVYLAWNPH